MKILCSSIGTSSVVDQETNDTYFIYTSEAPWLYHGQLRLNMRQWLTKVIKPYYNHVETWSVK